MVRLLNHLKSNQGQQNGGYAKNKINKSDSLTYDHRITKVELSSLLLDELFSNNKLRGLRLNKRVGEIYEYQWIDYSTSQNIIDDFLKRIKEDKIVGA